MISSFLLKKTGQKVIISEVFQHNSFKNGQFKIVASFSYHNRKRFDPICILKKKEKIYGKAQIFFSFMLEKIEYQFVIVNVYDSTPYKLWNLPVFTKPPEPQFELFSVDQILFPVILFQLGDKSEYIFWSEKEWKPEDWLLEQYEVLTTKYNIPDDLEEKLEVRKPVPTERIVEATNPLVLEETAEVMPLFQ
jgi:hypothetical protein